MKILKVDDEEKWALAPLNTKTFQCIILCYFHLHL